MSAVGPSLHLPRCSTIPGVGGIADTPSAIVKRLDVAVRGDGPLGVIQLTNTIEAPPGARGWSLLRPFAPSLCNGSPACAAMVLYQ